MPGPNATRRGFLRRSAAGAAGVLGAGLAGCAALPGGGDRPAFEDWFHVEEPGEQNWYAWYGDTERLRSRATEMNATHYARARASWYRGWWHAGIPHDDSYWTAFFTPMAGASVTTVAARFDRADVRDHLAWRDGEERGSHAGFDLYEMTERGDPQGITGYRRQPEEAYAVGDALVLGASTHDEDGPDPLEALRTVVDARGSGVDGAPATLADRHGFALSAVLDNYAPDEGFYNPSRLPGADAGGVSYDVAGEEAFEFTYAFLYEDGDPPDADAVDGWLDGTGEDPRAHPFAGDADPTVTVDGDVVEIAGTARGGRFDL